MGVVFFLQEWKEKGVISIQEILIKQKVKKERVGREGAEIEQASERCVGRTDCFQHGVIKLVLDN